MCKSQKYKVPEECSWSGGTASESPQWGFPVTSPTLRYVIFLTDAFVADSEMTVSQKVLKTCFLLVLIWTNVSFKPSLRISQPESCQGKTCDLLVTPCSLKLNASCIAWFYLDIGVHSTSHHKKACFHLQEFIISSAHTEPIKFLGISFLAEQSGHILT